MPLAEHRRSSGVVARGGVEPPTFRFSGIGTFQFGPAVGSGHAVHVRYQCLTTIVLGSLATSPLAAGSGSAAAISAPTLDGVKVPIGGSRRRVTEATHQVLQSRASGCRERLASAPSGTCNVLRRLTCDTPPPTDPRHPNADGGIVRRSSVLKLTNLHPPAAQEILPPVRGSAVPCSARIRRA
jgi:hypothetical protein